MRDDGNAEASELFLNFSDHSGLIRVPRCDDHPDREGGPLSEGLKKLESALASEITDGNPARRANGIEDLERLCRIESRVGRCRRGGDGVL